jgi:hypothetical protein
MIVWRLSIDIDRRIVFPGEKINASFTIYNPLQVHMYIHSLTWNSSFFPTYEAVYNQTEEIVSPFATKHLCSGWIRVPPVQGGEYQIDVVAHTHIYNPGTAKWTDLGSVPVIEPRRFRVLQRPTRPLLPIDRTGVLVKALNRSTANGRTTKKKRVFVSFDFDNDKILKEFIIGQSKLPDSPSRSATGR